MARKLTKQQVDEICYIIGDWYLQHKMSICDPGIPHNLGRAKEHLKEMICSAEDYETLEDEHKS